MDKLLWKTKFNCKFSDETDFLETILKSYGVDDIPSFLAPQRDKVINNPFLMRNMEEAVRLFHDNLNRKIVIKCDPDVDGVTSSALITNIIKHFNPQANIKYVYSYNKEHGLTYKDLAEFTKDEVEFIIIPDASILCSDAIQIKQNYDAPILILDHHIIEEEFLDTRSGMWVSRERAREIYRQDTSPDKSRIKRDVYTNYALTVNNTDGQYPNPTLSGVGVVRKFGEAYCEYYKEDDSFLDDYLDIISLGLIADSMDLRNLETRWYAMAGLRPENWKNEFVNELCNRLEDEIHGQRTFTDVGWVLAPRMNGVCRYGEKDELINLYRAMNGDQEVIEYQPRRKSKNDPKPPVEQHSLQWDMARVANNVKSRQDTEVRKFMAKIDEKIAQENLLDNSVLFVDCSDVVDKKTVTGLVANKLASKYFRPVVLLKSRSLTEYGGSCRGYDKGTVASIKEFLGQAGVDCRGHDNAAGVNLAKKDLATVIAKCNQMLPLDQLVTVHPVDWEIEAKELKAQYVKEVASNYAIWGNTVPTPTFAITNVRINASEIQGYGENKNFIRFTYNDVPYIKKYCSAGEYDRMTMRDRSTFGTNKKNLVLNIIGQFQQEYWEDKIFYQVKILSYDVVEDDDIDVIIQQSMTHKNKVEDDFPVTVNKPVEAPKKKPEQVKLQSVTLNDWDMDEVDLSTPKATAKKKTFEELMADDTFVF